MFDDECIYEGLASIERPGINGLIIFMRNNGFSTCPASINHRSPEIGGLAKHSNRVYEWYYWLLVNSGLIAGPSPGSPTDMIQPDSIKIVSWCHDLCKLHAYMRHPYDSMRQSTDKRVGHGALSVGLVKEHIELTPQEEKIIRYHMSYYYTRELNPAKGEYTIAELCEAQNDPLVLLFYFADHLATVAEMQR